MATLSQLLTGLQKKAKREGKAPTTQAGEFVREEVHHIREGKHGARSTKQAIAIGDGANDLLPILGDPNVHIMESKANTCDVLPGRRPRGPALVDLVEGHRARATRERTEGGGDR